MRPAIQDNNYYVMEQVNKYFFWEYISQRSQEPISPTQMSTWDQCNRKLARQTAEFATGYGDLVRINPQFRDAQIVTRVMNTASEELGERLCTVIQSLLKGARMSFPLEGVYRKGRIEDGRVMTIFHRSGIEVLVHDKAIDPLIRATSSSVSSPSSSLSSPSSNPPVASALQ